MYLLHFVLFCWSVLSQFGYGGLVLSTLFMLFMRFGGVERLAPHTIRAHLQHVDFGVQVFRVLCMPVSIMHFGCGCFVLSSSAVYMQFSLWASCSLSSQCSSRSSGCDGFPVAAKDSVKNLI